MSSGDTAPPPTRDEVLKVFQDDDRVFSAGDVLSRMWWARGGVGNYRDSLYDRQRRTNVPVPSETAVRALLDELVADRTLVTAVGEEANKLGSVWGYARHNGRYYALTETAEESRRWWNQHTQAHADAQQAASELAKLGGERILRVQATGDGVIRIEATVDQAFALLGGQPEPPSP